MTSLQCPDGHPSTTSDFCSECGLQMPPPRHIEAPAKAAGAGKTAGGAACPVCNTERDDAQGRFCGVCGYNFETGESGDVVPVSVPKATDTKPGAVPKATDTKPGAAPPARATSNFVPQAASNAPHIEIEITFDETHADAPKGQPARKFSLYDEESLIGRRSASTPQTLGLEGDDYLSRRHLLIIRQGPRSYVARLFDGTNGGTHNGQEMTAGVEVPLTKGDKMAIGTFTVIEVLDID